MKSKFVFETSGSLKTGISDQTLEGLEAFCQEARRLGVSSKANVIPVRNGFIVIGLKFEVPVIPKNESG